jgi:hypothetical protein
MAKAAVLNVDVIANVQNAVNAFEQLRGKASGSVDLMRGAAMAAGAGIAAELGVATKAAMDHEQHTAKLAQVYKTAGLSGEDYRKALEHVEATTRRTGQSTDDSIDAYTKLVTATHDSAQANKELALAQDLAAYKGTSVAQAADAINRASQGNTRALKAMGIATTDAAGNALSATEVLDALSKAVAGQADAMGDTAAGKMARYKESLEQVQVKIGDAVLPALQKMLDLVQPLFDWLSKNTGVLNVLVPILAGLAAVIVTITTVTKIWTIAQAALDVVLNANPISLIVIAIAALVAGVIVAYEKVKWFHDAVDGLFKIITGLASWIMNNWRLVVGVMLGPLGFLILNWQKVVDIVQKVLDVLGKIKDAASNAIGWLGKVPGLSMAGGAISWVGGHLPFGLSATAAAPATFAQIVIQVAPGDAFPEAVYRALKTYQRRHVRPELAPFFG